MRYATFGLAFTDGFVLNPVDEFTAPHNDQFRAMCPYFTFQSHRSRLKALQVAYQHNRQFGGIHNPTEWMFAIEVDQPDDRRFTEFFIKGECGSLVEEREYDFRFMYPTDEEWEILRRPDHDRRGEAQLLPLVESLTQNRPSMTGALREALEAYRRGLYRSTAAMLRNASEDIVGALVSQYVGGLPPEKQRRTLKRFKGLSAAMRCRVLEMNLRPPKLPEEAIELAESLFASYHVIRQLGNRGSHPQALGELITQQEATAAFECLWRFNHDATAIVEHLSRSGRDPAMMNL